MPQLTPHSDEHDNTIDLANRGERIFRFPDIKLRVPGHTYIATVNPMKLTLIPAGLYAVSYSLFNCQWQGKPSLEFDCYTPGGALITTITANFELRCHIHEISMNGSTAPKLSQAIARVVRRIEGEVKTC